MKYVNRFLTKAFFTLPKEHEGQALRIILDDKEYTGKWFSTLHATELYFKGFRIVDGTIKSIIPLQPSKIIKSDLPYMDDQIYEGDICEVFFEEEFAYRGTLKWNNKYCGFYLEENEERDEDKNCLVPTNMLGMDAFAQKGWQFKIVGDIYGTRLKAQ